MADRTQHKIGRNRPPRVQITYDVEIGDAMEVKELPFIVGVMADLAGHTKGEKFKDRKFVQIDKDNFDDVLESLEPSLSFPVPNKIDDKSENIAVELPDGDRLVVAVLALVGAPDVDVDALVVGGGLDELLEEAARLRVLAPPPRLPSSCRWRRHPWCQAR